MSNPEFRNQRCLWTTPNGVSLYDCQVIFMSLFCFDRITALNRVTSAMFQWSFLSQAQSDNIDIAGRVMLFLNSAINPTLYSLGSSFYRKAIVEAIGCGDSRRGIPKECQKFNTPSTAQDTISSSCRPVE